MASCGMSLAASLLATGSGNCAWANGNQAIRAAAMAMRRNMKWSLLMEEQVGNHDSGDDAGEVGKQAGGNCVARFADSDRAEIQGDDVERGVGRPLEDAGQAADEGVDAVGLHRVDHHR